MIILELFYSKNHVMVDCYSSGQNNNPDIIIMLFLIRYYLNDFTFPESMGLYEYTLFYLVVRLISTSESIYVLY